MEVMVLGNVQVCTYDYKETTVRTYYCKGNNDAAFRCAERELEQLQGKVGLDMNGVDCLDGDTVYTISWFAPED